ncbi:Protein ASPARTIC PROTEASE IN GUARD CELL 1 [Glycine soja]|uniref:Protein ASPARTIC PROTEASE IN GUARD CELL 1 n=1 Tax=Glycine soja TaxID=3848 RepID=A0A445KDS7_GLYSO|nr:Protein ASPARTIC PROTEASE IN GUARD CELL 1 [Glycine soja]
MVMKVSLVLVLLSIFSATFKAYGEVGAQNDHNNDPTLTNKEFYRKAKSSKSTGLNKEEDEDGVISAKLHLRHRAMNHGNEPKTNVLDSAIRDLVRIQTLHRKVIEKMNTNSMSRKQEVKESITIQQQNNIANAFVASLESSKDEFSGNIIATLEFGASLGRGEYFIDMFVGTPPKHVWLILDTGSDLSWIQCDPCYDCFEQNGPYYSPKDSITYSNISCYDRCCQLVSSPERLQPCKKAVEKAKKLRGFIVEKRCAPLMLYGTLLEPLTRAQTLVDPSDIAIRLLEPLKAEFPILSYADFYPEPPFPFVKGPRWFSLCIEGIMFQDITTPLLFVVAGKRFVKPSKVTKDTHTDHVASVLNILDDELIKNVGDYILRYIPFYVSSLPCLILLVLLLQHRYDLFVKNRITQGQNKVLITDRMWARLLSSTNLPSFTIAKTVSEEKREEEANGNVPEDFRSRARLKTLPYLFSFSSRLKSLFSFSSRPKSAGNRSVDTHIVVGRTHRTPYTAGKPTLSSLEPTEPPTLSENPYCRRSNPIEPTLSWVEENPRYRVATRVLKQLSVLKGQSFLREAPLTCVCCWVLFIKGFSLYNVRIFHPGVTNLQPPQSISPRPQINNSMKIGCVAVPLFDPFAS